MPIIKPKGMIIKGSNNRPRSGTVITGRQARKNIQCPECGEKRKLRKKERIKRLVPHIEVQSEKVSIEWEGYKWHCKECGRYFREQFPGLLPRRRYTESYRKEIFNLHKAGINQLNISRMKQVSSASVERWFQDYLALKNKEYQSSYQYSEQVGLDEHRFSRKVGFSTTICDLKKHRIIDVIKGRSSAQITHTLKSIPGRERVKMVNIDLSETYRSIAKEVFPNAVIVADRFHVIRVINQHFLKAWHILDETGKHNRGLLSLMRRHEEKLSEKQRQSLELYLESVPGLKSIYEFKQTLTKLLRIKHQTAKECRRLIPKLLKMVEQLKAESLAPLNTLGNTLDSWKEEIAAMWRFTKTNSITEGFHRKMKLIQRNAYGFKNFENYRLRVRVLCGSMSLHSILV